MRRQDREITDPRELREILSLGKYATIALCREGEPYLVTLSCGYDWERQALYFHCAAEGQKIDFIRANPAACATVIRDGGYVMGECAHQYASVIIRGTMSVVEDLEEKKHGLEVLLCHLEDNPDPVRERNFKDGQGYHLVTVLRLDIQEMTGKKGS
jgi:nitroimidazol reductase NimA-like FMN-containing flavoprotein (pyridoxamine 5'-phosphate oxidase superfamily)